MTPSSEPFGAALLAGTQSHIALTAARATLSPETLRRQGFFEPSVVTRLIDDHVHGVEDRSRQLWGLLAFTLWHERHVEQEPPLLTSSRREALVSG